MADQELAHRVVGAEANGPSISFLCFADMPQAGEQMRTERPIGLIGRDPFGRQFFESGQACFSALRFGECCGALTSAPMVGAMRTRPS